MFGHKSSRQGGARPGAGRPRKPRPAPQGYERSLILGALQYGPYCWDLELNASREAFTDDELREAFESWAGDERDWPEATYAHQRFVVGLDRDEALAASLSAIHGA